MFVLFSLRLHSFVDGGWSLLRHDATRLYCLCLLRYSFLLGYPGDGDAKFSETSANYQETNEEEIIFVERC